MQGNDFYSGAALTGAGTGAASGAALGGSFGGPYGALAGGLVGGGLGLFAGASANSQRSKATANQQKNLNMAMASMKQLGQQTYDNYLAGLKKAQAYYGPAMERWNYLYGTGTGQGNFQPQAE